MLFTRSTLTLIGMVILLSGCLGTPPTLTTSKFEPERNLIKQYCTVIARYGPTAGYKYEVHHVHIKNFYVHPKSWVKFSINITSVLGDRASSTVYKHTKSGEFFCTTAGFRAKYPDIDMNEFELVDHDILQDTMGPTHEVIEEGESSDWTPFDED